MITRLHFLSLAVALLLSACSSGPDRVKQGANLIEASATNVQLAVGYLRRGEYEIAEEKLLKAIEQNDANIEAYTTMAFLMMKLNRMEDAEDYYQEALDIKGNDPSLHNSYGAYLCRIGRVEEAMEEFRESYLNPFYTSPYLAYNNAGTCLLEKGDYEGAEKFLRKALKDQPRFAGALLSMAELGIKTEKYLMARAYIQRYHATSRPSAESLWIQVQAERALGDREHYLKYAKQLLKDFPDSQEAAWVGELGRNDRIRGE